MRERLQSYRLLISTLGFWQFLFYKIQLLRVHLLRLERPVSLFSKYAKFPLRFRPNTSDHAVFFQVFVNLGYRCLDDARDVSLIIDCGANVGYTSAYLLTRFPTARVIAVEPDPENFTMLEMNLAGYGERYRAVRAAIWSHATGLVMASKEPGTEWSRSVKLANGDEAASLQATDIGSLLDQSGCPTISVLKIDIEGAETAVFSSNYESWLSKVDNLAIELHGQEAVSIFEKAIASQHFKVSQCAELTVCTRA